MSEPDPDNSSGKQPPSREGLDTRAALTWGVVLGIAASMLVMLFTVSEWQWSWAYWGVQRFDGNGGTSVSFNRSEILRNISLASLALIALLLATWRSVLAHQAQKLSESGLIIDRFQKGAAMLDSKELSVRLAGIYALRELAMSDPRETYITVQDLLCDFVRERSKERQPELVKISKERPSPEYGPFPPDQHKALETVSRLRRSVSNARRLESDADWLVDLRRANLSGADLENAELSGADLSHANLSLAFLRSANLSAANLQFAKLTLAYVGDAILSGAKLDNAVLYSASFINTDLTRACFSNADLSHANLQNTNLSGVEFANTVANETAFQGADFRNAKLGRQCNGADFTGAYLANQHIVGDFRGAIFRSADLTGARIGADLNSADFCNANLNQSLLHECVLRNVKFARADLSNAVLEYCDVTGAKMRFVVMENANIHSNYTDGDNPPRHYPGTDLHFE